jgi:hypothetical protein
MFCTNFVIFIYSCWIYFFFIYNSFLGYSNSHKGFVCYDAENNKIRISRNVVFFENQYFFLSHGNFVSSSAFLPFLMMCLPLLIILSQELSINDVTHCLFLLMSQHLILFYKSLDDPLEFHNLQIGMASHILLFRPILILFMCLNLILRPLLKSVGNNYARWTSGSSG